MGKYKVEHYAFCASAKPKRKPEGIARESTPGDDPEQWDVLGTDASETSSHPKNGEKGLTRKVLSRQNQPQMASQIRRLCERMDANFV